MKKLSIFLIIVLAAVVVAVLLQDKYGCNGDDRDLCLLQLASEEGRDLGFCAEIESEDSRNDCYLLFVEEKGSGYETCALITDVAQRDSCYGLFVTDERLQPDVCPLISDGQLRDGCNFFVGKARLDASSCAAISSNETKNQCLDLLAQQEVTLACSQYDSSERQDSCYAAIANSSKDDGLCLEIYDPFMRDSCVYDFAQAYDSGLCQEMTGSAEPFTPDSCYFNRALRDKDEGLCLMINAEDRQSICKTSIGLYN